jgi:aspartate kinase
MSLQAASEVSILKFGGTSVASLESMKKCVERVREFAGPRVVVVSAQAGRTDQLYRELEAFREAGVSFSKREEDMFVTIGENQTAALFSGVLNSVAIPAVPLCGWQVPLKVEKASISEIETRKLLDLLRQGLVVVVAGFQGINSNEEVEALSRGGSDVSAVALACALGARSCHIFTDVPGIYQISPLLLGEDHNQVLACLSYDDALAMASHGTRAIHPEAVSQARLGQVQIKIRSTFAEGAGTTIQSSASRVFGVSVLRTSRAFTVHVLHNQLCLVDSLAPIATAQTKEALWICVEDLEPLRAFFLRFLAHGALAASADA